MCRDSGTPLYMPKYRYEPEYYIPGMVRYGYLSEKEARAEYARLRSVAQKRLERLSRNASYRKQYAYRMYGAEGFEPLSRGASPDMVGRALADVYHFLNLKTSTVTGIKQQREEALASLHEHNYDFITKDNIQEFGDFMEEARLYKEDVNNRGGSPTVEELFEYTHILKVPREEVFKNFVGWLEKRNDLARMAVNPPDTPLTAAMIRKQLGIKEKQRRRKKRGIRK